MVQQGLDRLGTDGGGPRETVARAAVVRGQFGDDHVVLRRLGTPAAQQRHRDQPGGEARDAGGASAAGQLVALGQDGLELQQLFLGGVNQRRTDRAHGQARRAAGRP